MIIKVIKGTDLDKFLYLWLKHIYLLISMTQMRTYPKMTEFCIFNLFYFYLFNYIII